jgi:hypothetical protein
MATPSHRSAQLVLSLATVLSFTPLHAQGAGPWSSCKTDSLSNYNCASYYSGTISLTSELKTPNGTETRSVVATVTAGRVVCRVKDATGNVFDAPGMLAAEHASTGSSGAYTIQVWCPGAKGERVSRNDSPAIDTYERQAADYATLTGKDAHDHPETDAANGVSGTETITWQLHR